MIKEGRVTLFRHRKKDKTARMQGCRKKIAVFVTGFVVAAGILSGGITGNIGGGQVQAAEVACTAYTGDNIEDQNYECNRSKPIRSYLTYENGTYMRVQAGADAEGYLIEYFDASFQVTDRKIVSQELPLFGGFYEMNGNYYILSGQTNNDESDSVEVYRITKYTKDWERVASCGLNGANTTVPFDAGTPRMAAYGNYLMIRTDHQMYTSEKDGYRHQANVTIQVDTAAMKIVDSFTKVMNVDYGYVSHSFNQFIQMENGKIVAVDHGDAYPRSIVLVRYPSVVTSEGFTKGISYSSKCKATDIVAFEGEIGANYTGAAVGGFEISDTAYLVAGSMDIDSTKKYSAGRDIFIGSVSKSTDAVKVNKITNYTAGEGTTDNPQFVKIGTNSYMLLWHRGASVYYTKIDGNGNRVGSVYSLDGDLSDCVPVLAGNKLVWYTWKNENVRFYQINVNTLSDTTVKDVTLGHTYQAGATDETDASVVLTCSKCGQSHTEYAIKSFEVFWYGSQDNGYYSNYDSRYDTGTNLKFLLGNQTYASESDASNQNSEMVWESSDTSIATVSDLTSERGTVHMLKPGIVTVSIYPKYNPSGKVTATFRVGKVGEIDLDDCDMVLSQSQYTYDGSSKKPSVMITYKGQKLVQNKDYTIQYKNNTAAGTATVTITATATGIFNGEKNLDFDIQPIDIEAYKLEVSGDSYIYDGTEKKPTVKVITKEVSGTKYLLSSSNYDVIYKDIKNAGTASVIVTGKGNYSGILRETFEITPKDMTQASIVIPSESYDYTGEAVKPDVTVRLADGTELNIETDYTIDYVDNVEAGTATIVVRGKCNYTGIAKTTFNIKKTESGDGSETKPGDGSETKPGDGSETKPGDGSETKPGDGSETKPGDGSETKPGDGSETKPGDGSETKPGDGSETKPGDGSETKPGDGSETKPGDGSETKPGDGSETKPGDGSETKPGDGGETKPGDGGETKPGDGSETKPGDGSETKPGDGSETKPGDGSETKPGDGSETKPGDGSETKPGDGSETKPGDGSETKPGDGSETKPGDGGETKPGDGSETKPEDGADSDPDSTGDVPAAISVKKTSVSKVENVASGVKLTWKKVSGATGYVIYRKNADGKSWEKIKTINVASKNTYTDSSVKSKHGTTYSYRIETYKSVNGQMAKAVSKEKTILRLTAPVKLRTANQKDKKLVVTWKKQKKISGYQIQYSTSKTFAKGVKTANASKSSGKAVIKKLKKGKTYYVRIRSYRKSGSKKSYSAWSNSVKMKCK